MSSLAATQADGYYLPPEYYESGSYKKQGKNAWFQKQQKLQQLSTSKTTSKPPSTTTHQVVRFELVDPCVCEGCGTRIGKGTRFNAAKEKVGNYLGAEDCPIYEFQTKCRICGHPFALRTDPVSRGFAYGPGIRRQERDWDATDVHGLMLEQGGRNADDEEADEKTVMEHLEQKVLNKTAQKTEQEQLQALQQLNQRDDVAHNAKVRSVFRRERKERKERKSLEQSKGWCKDSITLLPCNDSDSATAAEQVFGYSASVKQKQKWTKLHRSSIFSQASLKPKRLASAIPNSVHSEPTTANLPLKKQRRKLDPSQVVDLTVTSTRVRQRISASQTDEKQQPQPPSKRRDQKVENSSLSSLLACYASSSDDDKDVAT